MPEAVPFFVKAKRFESNMPPRDRSLLDVYSDLWLRQQYDDAFDKLKALVESHPDDIEAKSIYALLVWEFSKDTTAALAQLDEVLKLDPKFQQALGFEAHIYTVLKDYKNAIKYLNLIKEYHPESPTSYQSLANLHTTAGEYDEARRAYENYHTRFPDDADGIKDLANNAIRRRDFAQAEAYVEQLAREHGSDHYEMKDYYDLKANLANWQGKFRTALGYRFQAAKEIAMTNDSNLTYAAWMTIAAHYQYMELNDSATYYLQDKHALVGPMNRINHILIMVEMNPSLADSLRPIMEKDLGEFRSRLPAQLQRIGDQVAELFDAMATADTSRLIATFEKLNATNSAGNDALRTIGEYAAFYGQYQKAYDDLTKYLKDGGAMTSGLFYPYTNYLLGIANEGLGKTKDAIANYKEAMKYWDKAEVEIPAIKAMKKRLARLQA
jgi:hypothetical protein